MQDTWSLNDPTADLSPEQKLALLGACLFELSQEHLKLSPEVFPK